jgi:hypothetical protein
MWLTPQDMVRAAFLRCSILLNIVFTQFAKSQVIIALIDLGGALHMLHEN